EVLRVEMLLRRLAHGLDRDRTDPLGVAIDVVVAETEVFDLCEEPAELRDRVESQGEAAGEERLGLIELGLRDALIVQALDLAVNERERLSRALDLGLQHDLERPGEASRGKAAVHRVREAPLGSDDLHETRREATAAENVIHEQDGKVVGIGAGDADLTDDDVRLADWLV